MPWPTFFFQSVAVIILLFLPIYSLQWQLGGQLAGHFTEKICYEILKLIGYTFFFIGFACFLNQKPLQFSCYARFISPHISSGPTQKSHPGPTHLISFGGSGSSEMPSPKDNGCNCCRGPAATNGTCIKRSSPSKL